MFSCRGRGGVLVLHICTKVSAGKAGGMDGGESMRYREAKTIAGATRRPLAR